jgi:hypothetical protein
MSRGWCLQQVNISNAFFHGFLEEDVYMQQPLVLWTPAILAMSASFGVLYMV